MQRNGPWPLSDLMPRLSQSKLFDLIGSLYEIAQQTSEEAWRGAYLRMAEMFRAGRGGFAIYDSRADKYIAIIGTADPDRIALYNEAFRHIEPAHRMLPKLRAGDRYNRREHISDREFMASEIYRHYYKQTDIFHFEYQVFAVRDGVHGGLLFTRGERQPNFSQREIDAIRFILPHVERAFQVYLNLFDAKLENRLMAEAFDHIAQCLMVVGRSGNVIFANNGARHIIAAGDGLGKDREDRLKGSIEEDNQRLQNMLQAMDGQSTGPRSDVLLQITRPSGLRPLELFISPVSAGEFNGVSEDPVAIVLVTDPEGSVTPRDEILSQMFGMTAAEARIASLLAEGNSINKVCAMLKIKPNTARTHLKRIFSKTETRRQSELVKLILNCPAHHQTQER